MLLLLLIAFVVGVAIGRRSEVVLLLKQLDKVRGVGEITFYPYLRNRLVRRNQQ